MSQNTKENTENTVASETATPATAATNIAEESQKTVDSAATNSSGIDWKQVVLLLGLSWFMAAAVVFAYHKLVYSKSRAFAIVDINEIVNIKQLQFQQILVKSNVTDRDRATAYEMVTELGKILPEKVELLHQQCNCVILTKGAVIGGEAMDLTENLKAELGLAGISSKSLKEQMNAEQSMATNKFEHP